MKQIDVINLGDMTKESLIRYAYKHLETSLKEGWKFDWTEVTNFDNKTCCLGGAIQVQNPEVYSETLGIPYLSYKLNPITYLSNICAHSIEKTWKYKMATFIGRQWRVKPTLDMLLNESRIVGEFRE